MPHSRKIVVLLKGYPRLSETFIAQELLGLEKAGLELVLVALRHPTDKKRHAVHDEIRAPVHYLPEYLHQEPIRVLRALFAIRKLPGFRKAFAQFRSDLARDYTRNRFRRFGQAAVLVNEWPKDAGWLHAHFIHTPASVAAYASQITGIPWTVSAHAKDIWTSKDWELSDKLASARWAVTCTRTGYEHLQQLGPEDVSHIHLSYHGLDLNRFPHFDGLRPPRDGTSSEDPVTIISVGRAVEKKGYDVLLKAFALLPPDLHWRFVHAGDGGERPKLKKLAHELGIEDKITWLGAVDQKDVLQAYRTADIFALACRITSDGDRDGLPNVLVEAASQRLTCIATDISGIPELFKDDENGLLVRSEDPQALAAALERAIRDPELRNRLGKAAETKVRGSFDYHSSVGQLKALFESEWQTSK
ncbi:glycosyltransferase family 4 protein [Rhizobium sp. SL42]|uniref:glycosyltransferase family 4 protein n=1 Tax=Rhizobium sp. SL42 TaxID=2806346 RepID=UPI001F41BF76|nr:glycosyltransferase family 4 protein [Rhizobium sp. SL42]UJW75052.1 glycosyltransferase family 4 protein [Rhizobium sp. SL42]